MAGDWLKVEISTLDKPEVIRIARILKIDRDAAFGKLVRLWAWFDSNSVDGVVDGVVDTDIDELVSAPGFSEACAKVGWLIIDIESETITLPRFDKHNGESAKKRTSKNARQARWRAGNTPAGKRSYIPSPIDVKVREIDKETCVYCGFNEKNKPPIGDYAGARIVLDHVIPVARGGENSIKNLVCACTVCNGFKGNKTPDECGLSLSFTTPERQKLTSTPASTPASTREEKRRDIPKGASPPDDSRKEIFSRGVRILGEKNRGLIGKAVKNIGEEKVAEVIGRMMAKPPVGDPVDYFAAATKPEERGFVC